MSGTQDNDLFVLAVMMRSHGERRGSDQIRWADCYLGDCWAAACGAPRSGKSTSTGPSSTDAPAIQRESSGPAGRDILSPASVPNWKGLVLMPARPAPGC